MSCDQALVKAKNTAAADGRSRIFRFILIHIAFIATLII